MLAYWAHCWAAVIRAFCQVAVVQPGWPLSLANRSLAMSLPSVPELTTVPSGMKLRVISWGLGQALPVVAYGTMRDSNSSRERRGRRSGGLDGPFPGVLRKK